MLKPRLNQVFRSRWHALWWGAGICMTAYCSVPAANKDPAPVAKPSVAAHQPHAWWQKDRPASATKG
ncbi:MAG: hypothetical protein KGL48_06930 [Sphingomonadales bacterium]|nr:hypothetical protein [Sphingomonadales bacterium]MDE2569927.1 hypothetical protein [Sphingomonadales bacterium]